MTIKTTNSKENNFSLQNKENYNDNISVNLSDILNSYCGLMIDFLNLIGQKVSFKNKDSSYFIIIRGMNTINNIFVDLLFYTKNLDLTSFHVEKACYYYAEFVEQITEEQHVFLHLTSRDASMYVYKKTIFDINNEVKKNVELSLDNSKNNMFKILLEFTKIIRIIMGKIISNGLKNNTDKLILLFNKLTKTNINEETLKEMNNVLNILNTKINDTDNYINKLNEFISILPNSNKLKKYYECLSNE
jgi:hypothetical protein